MTSTLYRPRFDKLSATGGALLTGTNLKTAFDPATIPGEMSETDQNLKSSFAPVADDRTRILILGSLPGEASLERQQYYAHPRNRFWPLMAALLEKELPRSYDERLALLLDHGIGLWDVVHRARRAGSLDANIVGEIPNGLDLFLATRPRLTTVAFNGAKSRALFDEYFPRRPEIRYLALPSTSPANAAFNFERLLEKWAVISEIRQTQEKCE